MPFNIRLVEHDVVKRNNEDVLVLRFQQLSPKEFDAPHITFILCETSGCLVSYINRMLPAMEHTFSQDDAVLKATMILRKINPEHFSGLLFWEIEKPLRNFISAEGYLQQQHIYLVKFRHSSGCHSWVGLSMSGQVEEYEINSIWDAKNNRRLTEMWADDGWVKAKHGLGPELEAPAALARK